MRIITADERLAERRGVKLLLLGPFRVSAKQVSCAHLDPTRTLFVDVEAGDLSVLDLPVPTIRINDLQTARDLRLPHRRTKQKFSADSLLFAGAL